MTKTFNVYHATTIDGKPTLFRSDPAYAAAVWGKANPFYSYTKAATVTLRLADENVQRSLDDVYELTNHINHSWTENVGVKAEPGPQRSTSVGDVIQDEATGHVYLVSMFGFTEIV